MGGCPMHWLRTWRIVTEWAPQCSHLGPAARQAPCVVQGAKSSGQSWGSEAQGVQWDPLGQGWSEAALAHFGGLPLPTGHQRGEVRRGACEAAATASRCGSRSAAPARAAAPRENRHRVRQHPRACLVLQTGLEQYLLRTQPPRPQQAAERPLPSPPCAQAGRVPGPTGDGRASGPRHRECEAVHLGPRAGLPGWWLAES